MQQRPLGIVLSAIALGLAALVFFVLSLFGVLSALAGSHLPSGSAGAPMASAAVYTVITLGVTLLYLGLAGWAVVTLLGLLRMRSWARVSTMVMAGCMIGFGLLFAVGMAGAQSLLASGSVPIPPNVDPALLHKAMLMFAFVCFFVAALGVAWIIYFASRGTREAFTQAKSRSETPALTPAPYLEPANNPPAAPRRSFAAPPPAPNPLTDFTVARPLERPAAAPAPPAVPSNDEPHAG